VIIQGYESSPFCKIVREKLVELEIPHLQKSCARGSDKRNELLKKTGYFTVPYIEDPNTGVAMFESSEIVAYLEKTYAVGA
jgi:glutathione S-transferase